ncbi:zinc-ribbon domain-containing protein [Desulfoglaeba alkanexedens]|uniref:zinc-ribbon domain-containing protein n=1 Tax=Desulfoglaeba alkanexedens TaxID=361111 RepID=UPI00147752A5|nr:zinc-ribbon domain-containing protein [Desulfoglaeba alkanexedens]
MKLTCSGCGTVFSVPEEKLPKGKSVRLACPKCQTPMQVAVEDDAASKEGSSIEAGRPAWLEADSDEDWTPLELVDEGVPTALVCSADPGHAARVEQALKELNCFVSVAHTPKRALGRLRRNTFDVVVVGEADLEDSPNRSVLDHFRTIPMSVRRRTVLCVLSGRAKTMDAMEGFRLQADLVVHPGDLDTLRVVVQRTLREHQEFYKVFRDEMEKRGDL